VNSATNVHHGKVGTSTLNEHFRPRSLFNTASPLSQSSLSHLSESILPFFRNLPYHNEPPLDSDIAQLWEEVRKRVAKMVDPSDAVSVSIQTSVDPSDQISGPIPASTVTSEPPTELSDHSIKGSPTSIEPKNLDELGTNTFYYEVMMAMLAYRPEARGFLVDPTETQDTSISTQLHRPQLPSLSQLDFITTVDRSKGFDKDVFNVDVRKTLCNMGHFPRLATTIPSTVISENQHGPSYLYLLCCDQASTNIAKSWMVDAQKELTKQLRLHRINLAVEERPEVVSNLRHFCYLLKDSRLEVKELKIGIYDAKDLHSNTFNLPNNLPCECRTFYSLNLASATDRMKFYDVNDAIQKWGQAKQGREFMNNLLRLLDREECDEWLMSGEELQEYWEGIVFPPGATVNCL
jgi:hypothetical protein